MPITIKIRTRLSLAGVSHTHYLGEGTLVPVDPNDFVEGYKRIQTVTNKRIQATSYKDSLVEERKRIRVYAYKVGL